MAVAFRNVQVAGDDPEHWPYEAIVTIVERGSITDWAMLRASIEREPWGHVARQVERYLTYSQPWGVAPLLQRTIDRLRQRTEADERASVTQEIARCVKEAGLPLEEFARRMGTSRSRLSTYRSGQVVPSATLMVRMRSVARRAATHSPRHELADESTDGDTDKDVARVVHSGVDAGERNHASSSAERNP